MPERGFSRRRFLGLAAAMAVGAAIGSGDTYARSGESLVSKPDPDGKYRIGIPGVVADKGELPPRPFANERPNWPKEVLRLPVYKGPSDRPLVALTIDDGFLVRHEILDVLVSKGAGATFFLIGDRVIQKDQNFIFIKRALDLGYEIGNHTYTHGDLDKKTQEQIKFELSKCEEVLKAISPGTSTLPYLRPPGGNKHTLSIETAADMGYRMFLWTISGDIGNYSTNELVNLYLRQIDSLANPWGSIILMHFIPRSLLALPAIIDGIRTRGMEPVSLTRLYEGGRV